MLFDDTYKMYFEELNTSFSQLYKYPDYTANVSHQGPSRKGDMPDGFKGDKFGTSTAVIDGDLFPQTRNKTNKEIQKDKLKPVYAKRKKELIRNLKNLKKRS
jgi:hypothetical protein